jgi:hypothetical protein
MRSFDPPEQPEWHRMIAEAAYYFAQKRGFDGEHALDDWLSAEKQVRQAISPLPESDMNQTIEQNEPEADEAIRKDSPAESGSGTPLQAPSRFEKFAASQAAGDGIQGDARKPDKTVDEKIGANMADRK